ncbi:hypothetical protein SH661x_001807 [Planctomicrobium sp. SH661]|uniref:hypothetical protein n=1 Tax=Planctomicrobium sp. SH661 TaxID=3448124 RepID=UPI003F5B7B7B
MMTRRIDTDRSVDLISEPLNNGMRIEARVLRHQNFGISIRFDGTPVDAGGFITTSDAAIWMNALRALLDEAKELSFELKQESKAEKPKPAAKRKTKR